MDQPAAVGQSYPMDPSHLNRAQTIDRIDGENGPWDIVVIGGGATGLGCALDAASRGYRTALFEAGDFAGATSGRSTKLVHGGVRYLRAGQFALVREALRERERMVHNAPALVSERRFCIPAYRPGERLYYRAGLALYDTLGGARGFHASGAMNRADTLRTVPALREERLRGGVFFSDGQFDDARMAIAIARTAASCGAALLNYARVVSLDYRAQRVAGVVVRDAETGNDHRVRARAVINATGVFSDAIRRLDRPDTAPIIRASRGAHIVLDRRFLPGEYAVLVPRTDDGRVIFAIPWHERILVGTTDTGVDRIEAAPRVHPEDVDFLLHHVSRYLATTPVHSDILSQFAGLRPLVAARRGRRTANLSRTHRVRVSQSGLVTIAGGKWTTYRKMAQDAVDQAAFVGALAPVPSVTRSLALVGGQSTDPDPAGENTNRDGAPAGMDRTAVAQIAHRSPDLAGPIGEGPLPTGAEVAWAVRAEMARTVEDVLSRRSRALLLDAHAARRAAGRAAEIMARELGHDSAWANVQERRFANEAECFAPGVLP